MKTANPIHSRSYILRLWLADEPQAADWHASLEDPATKERFGFSSLEQLFAFVMEQSERDSGMFGGTSSMEKGGGGKGPNRSSDCDVLGQEPHPQARNEEGD